IRIPAMMLTNGPPGMQEKFTVAFCAQNRAIDNGGGKSGLLNGASNLVAREGVSRRVPYNSPSGDSFPAHLKLRLNKNDPVALGSKQRRQRLDQQRYGNKTHIAGDEIHRLANLLKAKISGVYALMQDDARIRTQLPIDLARSGIYRMHARGSVLEQAIGETAGRGADVHTHPPGDGNCEFRERRFQFQASPA